MRVALERQMDLEPQSSRRAQRQGLNLVLSFVSFVVFVVSVLSSSNAAAQAKLTLVPSISVSSLYDDNLFAKTIGSADQMTLFTPGLEATYETPVTMLKGEYAFDMQRSIDHPALNNLQARRHAMVDTSFHLATRFTFGFAGRYDRTDTAGELNYTTGLLLDRRRAERLEGGPSFNFQASPKLALNGVFVWVTERVADSVGADEQVARLGFTRQVTPRASFGAMALGRRFDSLGDNYTSGAPLFVWSYELAPATMVSLQAGPRYTSALNTIAPEIAFSLGRKAPNIINYGVDYWRGESIILGVVGPVEVNSATAKISWPIRTHVDLGVHGGLFNSQTLTQGRVRVYHGEVVASWAAKGPFIVALSYGADFQRGDVRSSLLSDRQVIRHVVLLRLTAAPRLSRLFQPDDPLQPLGDPIKGVK